MALTSWLLFFKKIQASCFHKIFCYLHQKIKNHPHLTQISKTHRIFTLTHLQPSERVTFNPSATTPPSCKFISWYNKFICWSSQFYNTNFTVKSNINFGNSNQWPMRSRNVFHLQNNCILHLRVSFFNKSPFMLG